MAGKSQLREYTKRQDSGSEELGKLSNYKAGQSSEPSLTWVHIAPILSPRKACTSNENMTVAGNNENQPVTAVLPPSRRGSPATQDSSVSSTTPYKQPKNLKKPIRCQSQDAAGQESDSETINARQSQGQSPHVTLKPLPRVCPNPLETWCIVKQRAGSLTLSHHQAESCSERKKGRGWRPVITDALGGGKEGKNCGCLNVEGKQEMTQNPSSRPQVQQLFQTTGWSVFWWMKSGRVDNHNYIIVLICAQWWLWLRGIGKNT